jgi:hypothetical protein
LSTATVPTEESALEKLFTKMNGWLVKADRIKFLQDGVGKVMTSKSKSAGR